MVWQQHILVPQEKYLSHWVAFEASNASISLQISSIATNLKEKE